MLIPVLLAGGTGTRLWPTSRKSYPKQFGKLIDEKYSLFQSAVKRSESFAGSKTGWIIVANDEHKYTIDEQLKEIDAEVEQVILEPFGRNTASAIALAALKSLQISKNAKLLIQTADHLITDINHLNKCIQQAQQSRQPLVTFGIKPTYPETGYGYIRLGPKISGTENYSVDNFVEKPNLKKAEEFLNDPKYVWNSGMFYLDAKTYLNELKTFNRQIYDCCKNALKNGIKNNKFIQINAAEFNKCPSISIDHAVMEKSKLLSVIPFETKWKDLGSWTSLDEIGVVDENRNSIFGDADAIDSTDTLIRAENRLVIAFGVADLIISETRDAVLVSAKDRAQDIGVIVEKLRADKRAEADTHVIGHRPWGNYVSVVQGKNFQVKKITVKPGKSLSLQSHKFRAEHWVVVAGTAEVINGDQKFTLVENQSTYIETMAKHRLSNPGDNDLIIIEIQTGSYLGEDDIIRYDDLYGRV